MAGHASGCWHSVLGAGVLYNRRKPPKVSFFVWVNVVLNCCGKYHLPLYIPLAFFPLRFLSFNIPKLVLWVPDIWLATATFTWNPFPGNVSPVPFWKHFPFLFQKLSKLSFNFSHFYFEGVLNYHFTQTCYPFDSLIYMLFFRASAGAKRFGLHKTREPWFSLFDLLFLAPVPDRLNCTLLPGPWYLTMWGSEYRNNKYCASPVTPTNSCYRDVQQAASNQTIKDTFSVI